MIVEARGLTGEILPFEFIDVVNALKRFCSGLGWFIIHLYGAGRADVLYPGDRNYEEFEAALKDGMGPLLTSELLQVAAATFDTYDVLLIGVREGDGSPCYAGSDPVRRFSAFARQYEVVAECVDSGFWRISVRDDQWAKDVVASLSEIPGVVISDFHNK